MGQIAVPRNLYIWNFLFWWAIFSLFFLLIAIIYFIWILGGSGQESPVGVRVKLKKHECADFLTYINARPKERLNNYFTYFASRNIPNHSKDNFFWNDKGELECKFHSWGCECIPFTETEKEIENLKVKRNIGSIPARFRLGFYRFSIKRFGQWLMNY